jgi:hypothetical protein
LGELKGRGQLGELKGRGQLGEPRYVLEISIEVFLEMRLMKMCVGYKWLGRVFSGWIL